MIPLRVRMRGWMRYRDEQVADFNDARLISICGENGAGKSSIFDAITYALYGRHRLGAQGTSELISEGMDLASVDFEFEQEGVPYRVHRASGRKSGDGSQCLYVADEGSGEWLPVPNSDNKRDLDAKLLSIMRMTQQAFTSSFLLTQGDATKFLDAKPTERFEIVAGLIGLDDYKALETRAGESKNRERGRRDDAHDRLAGQDELDEAAIEALRDSAGAARQAEDTARDAHEGAKATLASARRYDELEREIAALTARIEAAECLLAERDRIEADAAAFASLEERLSVATALGTSLTDAAAAAGAAADARASADAVDVDALDRSCAGARRHVSELEAAEQRTVTTHLEAIEQERASADFAVRATRIQVLRDEIATLETRIDGHERALEELPGVEDKLAEVRSVAETLPLLVALRQARVEAEKAAAGDPRGQLTVTERKRERLAGHRNALVASRTAADRAMSEAQQQEAHDAQAAQSVEEQRSQREAAAGEATCSRCGQPIEKKQARKELHELTTRAQQAKKAAGASQALAREAADAAQRAANALEEHDAALRDADAHCASAARAVDLLEGALRRDMQAYDSFRASAPPALTTVITESTPSEQIATVYNQHAKSKAEAAALAKRVADLQTLAGALAAERNRRDAASDDLARYRTALGANDAAIAGAASAHARSRKQLDAAGAARDAARKALAAGKTALEDAARHLEDARKLRDGLARDAERHSASAEKHRAVAETYAGRLDDDAASALADPDGTVARITTERNALADAPRQLHELRDAEQRAGAAQALRARARKDAADVPEAHRIAPPAAEEALMIAVDSMDAAKVNRAAREEELRAAEVQLAQVADARATYERADARYRLLGKLESLLGRNGLQGELVKGALSDITSHANAFLDRLTSGSLRLELTEGRGDELVLKAIDYSCMKDPRPVDALSGSQQFRCAVAVASGIGQYAGAGGMRSIVIDEGFGSLDLAGQRQIVEELKRLAEEMDRVIVVSHLEAFQDPDNFPDRLVVERRDGRSVIRRVN